jgi:hypothetical protein
VRALKTSVIMLQFSALETVANFLADLAIRTSEGIQGSPEVKASLTQVELDFLAERRTYVDAGSGALKISGSAFVPTLDKLTVAPLLLGKVHGLKRRIDKGGSGWQKIQQLKDK